MSVFEKYKLKRPAEFTRLVGVNYAAFNIILDKLKNEIIRYRNTKPVRNRGLRSRRLICSLSPHIELFFCFCF